MWTDHLAGRGSKPKEVDVQAFVGKKPFTGLVMGIDPSLRGSGLAVLEFSSDKPTLKASRTIKLKPKLPFDVCLGEIHQAVASYLDEWNPLHVSVEQTIYVQNFQTAQILGAARGAAISAVAVRGIPVFEYHPLRIKQAVVGFGRASKEQLAGTMTQLLATGEELSFDEADAAGAAFCHAMTWNGEGVIRPSISD
ncbi:MAG: crossover junction endodeoxyribonuclease RuvC [Opitutales bacterium]